MTHLSYGQYATLVLNARHQLNTFFRPGLFGDPALNIMLSLLAAAEQNRSLTTAEVIEASAVPPTTALRYINILVAADMIERTPDAHDGRRTLQRLTENAGQQMKRWLDDISFVPLRTEDT